MINGLFVNQVCDWLSIRLRILTKLIMAVVLIMLFGIISVLVSLFDQAQSITDMDRKLADSIEIFNEKGSTINVRDLDRFLDKVGRIKIATEFDGMGVIQFINILERSMPSEIRVQSLEYQSNKAEYRVRASTYNKEYISSFLEKMEKESFDEVMLTGQHRSGDQFEFTMLVKVSK